MICGHGVVFMLKALVVVDYQYDFVKGSLGFPEAEQIEDSIAEKIKKAKAEGDDVYFTLDCHDENYLSTQEGRNLPIEHCCTEKGRALYGRVAELSEGSPKFMKKTFGSIHLSYEIAKKPYDEVEVCGVMTNICVVADAVLIKTVLPEAKIVVDARCVATNDAKLREETFDVMQSLQISVINR
jgi:nicotinamidase/pyrazinamidase